MVWPERLAIRIMRRYLDPDSPSQSTGDLDLAAFGRNYTPADRTLTVAGPPAVTT